MKNCIVTIFLTVFISSLSFSQKDISNVSKWKSYPVPTNQDTLQKYNGSKLEWHIEEKNKQVYAKLLKKFSTEKNLPFKIKPLSEREKEDLTGEISFIDVEDGYLISFYRGEFGGRLYWFDKQGIKRKLVGRAMIVQFIKRKGKIYAISGLAHGVSSTGGIIEIQKEKENWKLFNYVNLNDAPYAINIDKKKNFIIVTSEHLFSVDMNKKVDILLSKGFWDSLYPTSLVVNKTVVFIGMRQGIFKFNLATNKQEWLMPD